MWIALLSQPQPQWKRKYGKWCNTLAVLFFVYCQHEHFGGSQAARKYDEVLGVPHKAEIHGKDQVLDNAEEFSCKYKHR